MKQTLNSFIKENLVDTIFVYILIYACVCSEYSGHDALQGVVLMSAQTGLAPPALGGAKPVCTVIRTTPFH